MPIQKNTELSLFERALTEGRLDEAADATLRLLGDEDSHFDGIIAATRCALARGDTADALRWAERGVRYNPDDLGVRAFYAALLLKAGRAADIPELLKHAHRAATPTPALILGQALLHLGHAEPFRTLLDGLLHAHPVSVVPLLGELADKGTATGAIPGWAAADTGPALVGALSPAVSSDAIVRVAINGVERLSERVEHFRARLTETGRFSIPLPSSADGAALLVTLDGTPLPGQPARVLSHPPVEGTVDCIDGRLEGWAWCPSNPALSVPIRLTDQEGRSVVVVPSRPVEDAAAFGIESGPFGFSADPAALGLRAGLVRVAAEIGGAALLGSPVWYGSERALPVQPIPPRPPATIHAAPGIDILIPVYGARTDTLACLTSVFDSLAGGGNPAAEVVVIDDASPDPDLVRELESLASAGRITLLRNERNMGFPGTVNRGLTLHPQRDVVLLNADTLVTGDWLARLRASAYSRPDAASVTPLSNDATILTYPMGTPKDEPFPTPDRAASEALDRAARTANAHATVEIPVAVGFCVYLRRDAVDETGLLDAIGFGRGYGEENDFCLRARRLGWRHLAALDVFVAHVGGRSFGRAKTILTGRNARILERRHPGYDALIRDFLRADPLLTARRRVDLQRWTDIGNHPSTLVITLGLKGGVARFVDERRRALEAQGHRVLTLAPDPHPDAEIRLNEWRRLKARAAQEGRTVPEFDDDGITGRSRLSVSGRADIRDLVFRTEDEFELLLTVLRTARVDTIEIHHVLGHAPVVLTIPERLAVPYDLFVHDYGLVCSRVSFVDDAGRYCGEPPVTVCARCVADPADRFDPELTPTALRQRSRLLVSHARHVVTATRGTAERILRLLGLPAGFPRIVVAPWEGVVPLPPVTAPPPLAPGQRRRVVVVGAVGQQKGYDVLLACAQDAAERDLPLEFLLAGFTDGDARLVATGRVFIVGRFTEDEAVRVVREQRGDLAFLPSITPETWCYALSTVWRAGLRAVAFDLGAIAERIAESGCGWLLPQGLDAPAINDRILSFLDDSATTGVVSPTRDVFSVYTESGEVRGAKPDIIDPEQVVRGAFFMPSPNAGSESTLPNFIQATTQVLTLAPGFYSMCVLAGGSNVLAGQIPLPSVQISGLPVPAAGSGVEFLSALPGNWLAKTGDAMVIRVFGAQSGSVVLTSFKHVERPNESLHLQFARIDDGTTAQGAAPAATAPAAATPAPQPRTELMLHISRVGDQVFPDSAWAGVLGQNQWIEAFAINPAAYVSTEEIEYKGLTANGWETAWLPGGSLCGSRGAGTPLIGFSVRLKGGVAERFNVVYEAAFASGRRTTPVANGAPCRSDVIGDPLEGILLRIVPKVPAAPRVI